MVVFGLRRILPAAAMLGLLPCGAAQTAKLDPRSMAPYVPTPPKIAERMLELAEVTSADTVYDLGSGDGRILIYAAQKFGAQGVGIELDLELVERAKARIRELGMESQIQIVHGHLLEVNLEPASVVTVYLLGSATRRLRPKLEKELAAGARVVSHDFKIMPWTPIKTETIEGGGRQHTIYVYEIGKR